ncbi:MAG: hypothetical protein ABIR70_09310 [Bryobacteraceae bacterium]
MQSRIIASIAGGLFGVVLDSFLSSWIDLNPLRTLMLFTFIGMALGWVLSLLIDVFADSAASDTE